jgi:hypothetical protein
MGTQHTIMFCETHFRIKKRKTEMQILGWQPIVTKKEEAENPY